MERLHVNYLRDVIYRLRAQESDRQIARDLHISRQTVRKYREWADEQEFLQSDSPLPDEATLAAALGPSGPSLPARPTGRTRKRQATSYGFYG